MLNPGLDLSFNINPTFGIQKFAKTKKKAARSCSTIKKKYVASHLFKKKKTKTKREWLKAVDDRVDLKSCPPLPPS